MTGRGNKYILILMNHHPLLALVQELESKYSSIHTGCAVTPCSKQIFSLTFSIVLLFHNSKPGKWFLLIG
jgi:hypothetical protein